MGICTGYAGTYASPQSMGIYRFSFDTESGALGPAGLYYNAPDAKYLSLREGQLSAPVQRGKLAGVCLLDTRGTRPPKEALTETVTACHVAQDGQTVYTANFHEGAVLAYEKPGLCLKGRVVIREQAGCHQILLRGGKLFVPCLELDEMRIFDAATLKPAGCISFPAGSGPRHGVFAPDGRLFVAGQRSHTVFVLRPSGNGYVADGEFPVLPKTGRPEDETAAIRLSPDGRFLYVSTRGPDCITVFHVSQRLEPVQYADSGGTHPRDFVLSRDGRFLLAANRYAGGIASFRLDPKTGKLDAFCGRCLLAQAVALQLDEPAAQKAVE